MKGDLNAVTTAHQDQAFPQELTNEDYSRGMNGSLCEGMHTKKAPDEDILHYWLAISE